MHNFVCVCVCVTCWVLTSGTLSIHACDAVLSGIRGVNICTAPLAKKSMGIYYYGNKINVRTSSVFQKGELMFCCCCFCVNTMVPLSNVLFLCIKL